MQYKDHERRRIVRKWDGKHVPYLLVIFVVYTYKEQNNHKKEHRTK